MKVSMSRRANAWDNAPMESFFKTLKVDRIYQVRYETGAQARLDIVDWVEGYYNRQRLHTSIDFCTPAEYEARMIASYVETRKRGRIIRFNAHHFIQDDRSTRYFNELLMLQAYAPFPICLIAKPPRVPHTSQAPETLL
jgi:hypothetical protein